MPLKLVRRPNSPNWVIRGTLRGIRVEESTGTGNKQAADEILVKRAAEILAESIHGRRAVATFAEASVSYMETVGATRFMTPIVKHFGTMPLARIDQGELDRAARKLYPKASPSTRNRQFFTPVSAVLHHAARRGWCSTPVIERPKQGEGRIRWINLAEANGLIDACSDHLRPLVIFLLYTGARVGEALWLDWQNVDLSRAHVTFPKTKNGEARGVTLHERVLSALANLSHRDEEIFRRPDGKPYERPTTVDDTSAGTRIKSAFKGACRRAGIENFTPHDCRHTWATWHYAANRDLGALQRLGGWKSVRMVTRYAHVNVDELADTIDRLPGEKSGESDLSKEIKS